MYRLTLQIDAHRAADEPATSAKHRDGVCLGSFQREQGFLGSATSMPQRHRLPGVQLQALGRKGGAGKVGQRHVHVVPTDQGVRANGHPLEFQGPIRFVHTDQGEIGRAATHVADQQGVAHAEVSAPLFATVGQPGVQSRLRFFQQDQICWESCSKSRLACQFTRTGIK